jgi:pimeloyl-ACP methyl ester carboxylesterase
VDLATNPLDGVPIAYRSAGTGPAVVLVHGTALSQAIWRGFGYVRDLAVDHQVITLDLRGHGRSGKPHEASAYGMEFFVADVLAVLDEVGVGRADYLGYSLGGRVGFSLADAHPQRVRRFVSVAGAPANTPGAFDRVFFPRCILALESSGMPGFLDDWEADAQGSLDPATRAAFAANDPVALAAYMREAENDAGVPPDRLARLEPETLLLVGSGDHERFTAAEYVAATSPRARLVVIPGAGHGDVLRHPDALPLIRRFLVR